MKKQVPTNSPEMPAGDQDPTAAERKRDHIELAFRSQVERGTLDSRFYYEPLLGAHPQGDTWPTFPFLGKAMRAPLWVSSMTGGTAMARIINQNLARACGEFGLGMGLGSCRSLLYSDETLSDFAVRPLMGPNCPLYANLGIAQLDDLLVRGEWDRIPLLLSKLDADGLIIHVNPFQEWLQPEGDRFRRSPLETIEELLDRLPGLSYIVKEVGQGMGPASLRALMQLPLTAIDFAASGGTNFAKLELLRATPEQQLLNAPLAHIGHSPEEMVAFVNQLTVELGSRVQCSSFIISGGVRDFLDGYYLIGKIKHPAIYGQASGLLRHAQGSYADLRTFVAAQLDGLALARAYLRIRE